MKRVCLLLVPAAALGLCLLSSCSREDTAAPLPKIQNDCTEWCGPAWEEDTTRQVCREACRQYVDLFRRCSSDGKACGDARVCALKELKQACALQGEYAQVCQDSGRFAHHLMLEVCKTE